MTLNGCSLLRDTISRFHSYLYDMFLQVDDMKSKNHANLVTKPQRNNLAISTSQIPSCIHFFRRHNHRANTVQAEKSHLVIDYSSSLKSITDTATLTRRPTTLLFAPLLDFTPDVSKVETLKLFCPDMRTAEFEFLSLLIFIFMPKSKSWYSKKLKRIMERSKNFVPETLQKGWTAARLLHRKHDSVPFCLT